MTTSGDGSICWEVSGDGEPCVWIHGLGGTLNVWEPQIRHFADSFRNIRLDLRGSGRSPASGPLSIDGWVEDLKALLDGQGIRRARFVAHSLGTLVLQHFAARYPAHVERMALLGINRGPSEARRDAIRDRAAKIRQQGIGTMVDQMLGGAVSDHSLRTKPLTLTALREMLLGQSAEGYAWSCEAMADAQPADRSAFDRPLLLIAGADDGISPVVLSQELAKESGARLIVIPQCGHWLPLEQHKAVIEGLQPFLTEDAS